MHRFIALAACLLLAACGPSSPPLAAPTKPAAPAAAAKAPEPEEKPAAAPSAPSDEPSTEAKDQELRSSFTGEVDQALDEEDD